MKMFKKQQVKKRQQKLNTSGIYQCYVCFSRLIRPVSCMECKKMLCGTHIDKLKNKCPNCRAQPFKIKREEVLASFLEEISKQQWQTLSKQQIHKCMISHCQFEGNYVGMLKHRKRSHSHLSIEDVMTGQNVSDEARKTSLMRSMIRKLIAYKVMQLCLSAIQNPLMPDDASEKKKQPSLQQAKRMAEHVATCTHSQCRKLWNTKWGTYIGRAELNDDESFCLSECPTGRQLNVQLGWKYGDPKH